MRDVTPSKHWCWTGRNLWKQVAGRRKALKPQVAMRLLYSPVLSGFRGSAADRVADCMTLGERRMLVESIIARRTSVGMPTIQDADILSGLRYGAGSGGDTAHFLVLLDRATPLARQAIFTQVFPKKKLNPQKPKRI